MVTEEDKWFWEGYNAARRGDKRQHTPYSHCWNRGFNAFHVEDNRTPRLQKEPWLRYNLRYFFPRDSELASVSPPESTENWTRLSDRVHPELVSPLCELTLFALKPHCVNPFDGRESDRVLYIHNDDLERFLWFRLEAKLKFEFGGRFDASEILKEVCHFVKWRDQSP